MAISIYHIDVIKNFQSNDSNCLFQSPLATADHRPDSRRPSNAKSVRSITSPASERGRRATIHVMAGK